MAEHKRFRAFAAARDEARWRKVARMLLVTVATGFVIELVLMPIALFHFHKAGMLGAFANVVAIPLTTFVVMPLEALALLFDVIGLGAPFWWLTQQALLLLLAIAHGVSASPWATMLTPSVPSSVFSVTMGGLVWCLLWRSRWRWVGLGPVGAGVIALLLLSPPDILVTGDGRHVVVRTPDGRMAILRAGAGDYVRDILSESAGYEGALEPIARLPQARCSSDLCAVGLMAGGRRWQLLVTRSDMLVDRATFARDCAAADIVIADRGLPRWCHPRWLKIDRRLLARTGGIAVDLDHATIRTAHQPGDAHPWIAPIPKRSRRYDPSKSRPFDVRPRS